MWLLFAFVAIIVIGLAVITLVAIAHGLTSDSETTKPPSIYSGDSK